MKEWPHIDGIAYLRLWSVLFMSGGDLHLNDIESLNTSVSLFPVLQGNLHCQES